MGRERGRVAEGERERGGSRERERERESAKLAVLAVAQRKC